MISHYKIPGGVTQKPINRKENVMKVFANALALVIAGVFLIVFFGLLMSLPVMLLWNSCLVAAIPGIKEIGWIQAWGILVLSGLLFRGASATKSE